MTTRALKEDIFTLYIPLKIFDPENVIKSISIAKQSRFIKTTVADQLVIRASVKEN